MYPCFELYDIDGASCYSEAQPEQAEAKHLHKLMIHVNCRRHCTVTSNRASWSERGSLKSKEKVEIPGLADSGRVGGRGEQVFFVLFVLVFLR